MNKLTKLIITPLIALGLTADALAMEQSDFKPVEYVTTPETLKASTVKNLALKLAEGTLKLGAAQALCPDIMELIKEQIIFDNLLLFAGLFSLDFRELKGHDSEIDYVILTPDEKCVLTSSNFQGGLRLWDLSKPVITGKILQDERRGPLAVSPCGRFALSADAREGRLWNLTENPIRYKVLPGNIADVAFHPTGKYVLTALQEGSALLWDIQNEPRCVKTLGTQLGFLSYCAFSPNGRYASFVASHKVYIFDLLQDCLLIHTLEPHSNVIYEHAWSPDSTQLLTCSSDRDAILWDQLCQHPRRCFLNNHKDEINTVAFSHDGLYAITGSKDCIARVWALKARIPILVELVHSSGVRAAAFHPQGRYLLVGTQTGAFLWDITQTKHYLPLPGTNGPCKVLNVSFSKTGNLAVSGDMRTPQVWNFFSEPRKLSLKLLLMIIAASKNKMKAQELKTACNTIKIFECRDKSKKEHGILKEALCKNSPLVKELFALTPEQIQYLIDYDFEKCIPERVKGLTFEAQRTPRIDYR